MKDIEDWNDDIKLQKLREPEPSNHPDARMHLTLSDAQRFYDPPQDLEMQRARLMPVTE